MSPRCDSAPVRRVHRRSAHPHVACLLLSEEVLGMHDSIQRYHKYELAVPLRLLPLSGAKHRLARDVSTGVARVCPQASVATGAVKASTLTSAWLLLCLHVTSRHLNETVQR